MGPQDWQYVYHNEETLDYIFSAWPPAWDNNKHGFYAGGKRCVAALHVSSDDKIDWVVEGNRMHLVFALADELGYTTKEGRK